MKNSNAHNGKIRVTLEKAKELKGKSNLAKLYSEQQKEKEKGSSEKKQR